MSSYDKKKAHEYYIKYRKKGLKKGRKKGRKWTDTESLQRQINDLKEAAKNAKGSEKKALTKQVKSLLNRLQSGRAMNAVIREKNKAKLQKARKRMESLYGSGFFSRKKLSPKKVKQAKKRLEELKKEYDGLGTEDDKEDLEKG